MDSENKYENMETLKCRDERLEQLWAKFHDVPMDPDTERIDEPFLHWTRGVHREDIWAWFDQRYSKGIVGLLYPGTDAREAELLYKMKQSCMECDSCHCAYNVNGLCRFPMVYERQPVITEKDGCVEFVFRE